MDAREDGRRPPTVLPPPGTSSQLNSADGLGGNGSPDASTARANATRGASGALPGAQHSVNTAAAAPTAEKLLLLRVNVPRLRTPASLLRPRGGKPTSAAASSVILAARDGSRLMP